MARGSYFKPNYTGYRAVLNGSDAQTACEIRAGSIAASAARQSGISYGIDSMRGLNRIHTRVSTVTREDFFRERSLHALSIACSVAGGSTQGMGSYGTVVSRVRSAHKSKYKGWKAGRYR